MRRWIRFGNAWLDALVGDAKQDLFARGQEDTDLTGGTLCAGPAAVPAIL